MDREAQKDIVYRVTENQTRLKHAHTFVSFDSFYINGTIWYICLSVWFFQSSLYLQDLSMLLSIYCHCFSLLCHISFCEQLSIYFSWVYIQEQSNFIIGYVPIHIYQILLYNKCVLYPCQCLIFSMLFLKIVPDIDEVIRF